LLLRGLRAMFISNGSISPLAYRSLFGVILP
jgi:hypothetical protein